MDSDPLTCDECGEFLSHAPVFLRRISGESLCGVCADEQPDMIRNQYYELVAQHLRFPCKYEQYGCAEAIVFSPEESEEHPHEVECKYRAYLCPLDKTGECHWQGPIPTIYLHFLREHPSTVFENPCVFNHDIQFSNIYIGLVATCGELFLIQAEVMLPEGSLYHSVRLFGKPSLANEFKFDLLIRKSTTCVSRSGNVLPMDSLEVNADTAITTKITNLLDLMGDFNNIKFTITIKNVDDLQDDETDAYCHYCNKWEYLEHGVCNDCRSDVKNCSKRHDGCYQTNIAVKIEKHEMLYCNFVNWCSYCNDSIYPVAKSRNHHYLLKHAPYLLGAYVTITQTFGQFTSVFFRCEYGIIFCNYSLSNKKLEVQVVTPLLNVDLRHFRCKIFIESPSNGNVSEFTLEFKTHSFYDWLFYLQRSDFATWDNSFNIKLEMKRD